MKDLLLTLDIGTGSTRAGLVMCTGEILGFAQREYDQITSQAGWAEQPPSLWWQSACECTQELLVRFAEYRPRIAAVGVCGQMHGTVLLDADGELVVDRALLWNDKRSQPQVDNFKQQQAPEPWLALLNNPPAAAWPAFKLCWLRENHPEQWAQVATVLMPKDYINFRLCGVRATDYSEASCYYLMDSATQTWSETALNQFQLRRDQLPALYLSSDVIGQIDQSAAAATGLPVGIPVVAGAADMAATLLGSGVYQPGTASDSTGTSTLLTVVAKQPLLDPWVNNLHLANSAWGGFTILDAGGDAMRWARMALNDSRLNHQQMLDLAANVSPGAEGLLFLPYLTGERLAEHTNSRAQFFGLQRKHRQEHLYRAVLEGVALAALRNLQQLRRCTQEPDAMIASGGGARSALWLQIKSSAYNLPILQTRNQENGTTGCAIIAGVGIGLFSSFAQGVSRTVSIEREITPDPRLHEHYLRCFELFEQLYGQAQSLYEQLDVISSFSFSENKGTPQ
ncbi:MULTISPECIES: xylulokinase [Yersinia]|uniref:Carbohydrate kinase n=1 Tax=Yersinia frederiksenii TaxID=29484 RepID=A0AAI8ZP09_YERFR|nr:MULTISPECIES: FGGY family carbohydrate kinase [Yersinia]MDN0125701.1 FGGY family carbohydrate kinase [Yersinia massiliensis]CFQ91159.1 carbohydrate kinase [Yersinia frederiksenii]CNL27759.1 carbohydrate kinase [Yersinia frederiksenii]HEC1650783.1 pentose kinase [Yersinia enterocolitica]